MVAPAVLNHRFTRGDDYSISVTFTNTAGTAQNISAWTNLRAHIRPNPDSDVVTSFAISTAGAASGVLVLTLTQAQTATLGSGVWDLERTSSGSVQTVAGGVIIADTETSQ